MVDDAIQGNCECLASFNYELTEFDPATVINGVSYDYACKEILREKIKFNYFFNIF